MSDNAYTDTYGPSTPGALKVVSGQTNGMTIVATTKQPSTVAASSYYVADGQGGLTMINDVDPARRPVLEPKTRRDDRQEHRRPAERRRHHLGRLHGRLQPRASPIPTARPAARAARISTVVGKRPSPTTSRTTTGSSTTPRRPTRPMRGRARSRPSATASSLTARRSIRPTTQYDLDDFYAAVKAGNFPAVSYIKLPAYQDGHAGYSDPLDEQAGFGQPDQFPRSSSRTGRIPRSSSPVTIPTAGTITPFATPTSASFDAQADQLNGPGLCGTGTPLHRRRRQAGERPLRAGHAHSVPGDLALDAGRTM